MPVSDGLVTGLVFINLASESLFALYELKTLIAYLLLGLYLAAGISHVQAASPGFAFSATK